MSSVTEARPAARTRAPVPAIPARRSDCPVDRPAAPARGVAACRRREPDFPTPVETAQFLVDEFRTPFGSGRGASGTTSWCGTWSSPRANGLLFVLIILIGVPVGYAMGRWWRVQAFFTDLVTVGSRSPPSSGRCWRDVVRVR